MSDFESNTTNLLMNIRDQLGGVRSDIKTLTTQHADHETRLRSIEAGALEAKGRAGAWGFLAGAIPTSIGLAWEWLRRK